jgi:predicted dehydrogenase
MMLGEPALSAGATMIGISVIGEGPLATAWTGSLARVSGARLLSEAAPGSEGRTQRTGPANLTALLEQPAAQGVVLAGPAPDLYALAKHALLAGKHVLHGGPFLLRTHQVATLRELARRQGLLLAFREDRAHHPAFAFLARMVSGAHPFWPPVYARSLRTMPPEPEVGHQVDALAAAEIATMVRLLGPPGTVAAVGCRGEEGRGLDTAFLTLFYGSGLIAQVTVSLAEATPAAELTVVAGGRTLTLDDFDLRAPFKVAALPQETGFSRRSASPPGLMQTAGEHLVPNVPVTDPMVEQARAFVEAIASEDLGGSNASLSAQVALVWETALESITQDGRPVELPGWPSRLGHEKAPPLRVIEGGGSGGAAEQRPVLTLIRR